MKKYIIVLSLCLVLAACSYDKNPSVADGGFLVGTIETYSGASSRIAVKDIKVETLPTSKTALSDVAGKFYLDDVPEGDYILYFTKDGFYDAYFPGSIRAGNVVNDSYTVHSYDSTNQFPTIPINPFPSDEGKSYATSLQLYWNCSDPDTNQLYFDVFFSEQYPPTVCIAEAIRENKFKIENLMPNITYYWRVHVRDFYGAEILGDIWSFTIKEM